MIKKVKLKYFQSHEDAQIDFTEGLNLIVGQSNSGKSSIIRALSLVARNEFDKNSVRVGHTYCQVTVQTDKGWVECQRGEGINKWRCFDGKEEKEYRNIGAIVPEEVTSILGMGQRDRGQVKQMPNFMFQLEKHYMLSEIDGKKATSNLVARMMDNAIGLGGMQDLIKDIATDLTKDKKRLNELTSQISELKSDVIDDTTFDTYKSLVEKCKRLDCEIQESEQSYRKAQELYKRLTDLQEQREKYAGVDIDLQAIERELQMVIRRTELISRYKELKKQQEKYKYLDVVNLNFDGELENLRKLSFKIKGLEQAHKRLWGKLNLYRGLKVKMNMDQERYKEIHGKCEGLKKQIGYCPLCGRKFE